MRLKFSIALIILFFMNIIPASASWWDTKAIPVPPHTQALKEKNKQFKDAEFDVVYYNSSLDAKAICAFYEDKLAGQGWKKRDPFAGLGKVKGMEVDPALNAMSGNCLVFRKDNQIIVVRFIAEGKDKTTYILGKNKVFLSKKEPGNMFLLPRTNAELKHKNIPQYAGAELFRLKEEADSFRAMFFSKDKPEPIAEFYRNYLKGHGWSLQQEQPLRSLDFSKIRSGRRGALFCLMVFSKPNEGTCKICLMRPVFNDSRENYTTIRIDYEK